jgi:hypothetical protein
MTPKPPAIPESQRIGLLLERDGYPATRAWVERTLQIYRAALARREHYAHDPHYRARFEQSVDEFQHWLDSPGAEPEPGPGSAPG